MKTGTVGPCSICEAPTARTFHFGAKSCKACAAFFRRTVALKVKYKCRRDSNCLINFDKRYMCKQCRLDKCKKHGMMEELVESKGKLSERKILIKQKRDIEETDVQPELPSCSSNREVDIEETIVHYVKIEAALVDRRRIIFSDIRMRDVLYDRQDCPFQLRDLTLFNYKTYQGCHKFEFAAVFDYVRQFARFEDLHPQDQDILYRLSCAVDALMCMAFYSVKCGMEKKILIGTDATFYPMDPLPFSGNEKDFLTLFESAEEAQRYKTLISPMAHYWTTLILPLSQLNPSFAEFSLLKALVCWHICYYKFLPEDQEICSSQRNLIMRALFKIAEDNETGSGVTRTGELLLYINAVFEHTYDLLESLYMMRIFNIVQLGDFVSDLLNQSNIAHSAI